MEADKPNCQPLLGHHQCDDAAQPPLEHDQKKTQTNKENRFRTMGIVGFSTAWVSGLASIFTAAATQMTVIPETLQLLHLFFTGEAICLSLMGIFLIALCVGFAGTVPALRPTIQTGTLNTLSPPADDDEE